MVAKALTFCGRTVTAEELAVIRRLAEIHGGLSRTELASTVCELLGWKRPNGGLKTIECRQFLESLHERSVIQLPTLRVGHPRGSRTAVLQPLGAWRRASNCRVDSDRGRRLS